MSTPTDIGIALAWPSTWCKQAGAWYDRPLQHLGFNRSGGYVVGHAALVLLPRQAEEAHYFDCGRYHAPAGLCRVRSARTDHDLRLHTRLVWETDAPLPLNLEALLEEVAGNAACHGEGPLHWGAFAIDHARAQRQAQRMQDKPFHRYGPFAPGGTNCSRFVNSVLRSGMPPGPEKLLLTFPRTLTPAPLGNVRAAQMGGIIGVATSPPIMAPGLFA